MSQENKLKEENSKVIEIDFKKGNGIIPVIIQDVITNEILMLGYMNEESWKKTLEEGKVCFWSRSRGRLWLKGEESGHFQEVKEIYLDCDGDALLIKVNQIGKAACHTGYKSCFHYQFHEGGWKIFGEPMFNPEEVYKK